MYVWSMDTCKWWPCLALMMYFHRFPPLCGIHPLSCDPTPSFPLYLWPTFSNLTYLLLPFSFFLLPTPSLFFYTPVTCFLNTTNSFSSSTHISLFRFCYLCILLSFILTHHLVISYNHMCQSCNYVVYFVFRSPFAKYIDQYVLSLPRQMNYSYQASADGRDI